MVPGNICIAGIDDILFRMMDFKISVDDGSEVLSSFAVEQNTSAIELYDWQRQAIEFFYEYPKCLFEIVTGGGKSLCAVEIIKDVIRREPDINVLIVVPKNVILEDTWYRELYNNGVSIKDIGVFYGNIKECAKITITNMQNIDKLYIDMFNMVIFDECHNFMTSKMTPYLKYPFKYNIGLSATIERLDGKHIELMEIYDYKIFKYNPHEALADGILNPFNFYNVGVKMDEENYEIYLRLTKEINTILQIGGGLKTIKKVNMKYKNLLYKKLHDRKILINNYHKKFDVAKVITNKHRDDKMLIFNQYNEQTNKFYWHLLDVGIKARIIHSGIEKEIRDQTLIDFRNDKFNVLLTTKVLDEGYNLPSIDCGVIMAGDSTAKQTIQRLGRVLRKKDRISNLYQVFCLGTIEEDQAKERSGLFKQLCSDYKEYHYDDGTLVL